VVTTRFNSSPSSIIETCLRISRIIKDFLGVLNEESIKKNFALVYEILEELLDFGYP
jgi:AP-4 complex subunit mu-1